MGKTLLLISAIAVAWGPAVAALAAPSVCLRGLDIEDTTKPDDQTLLFRMRNGDVWQNKLVGRCPGLVSDTRGFTYEPTNPTTDEICSNLVTIRLNTYGSVCLLGEFTKLSKH